MTYTGILLSKTILVQSPKSGILRVSRGILRRYRGLLRVYIGTLHYQKYVDTCSTNISFQNHGHQHGVGRPFAAITASTLLGRLSTRCWNIAAGSFFHSVTRALVRLGTDVGLLGLACSRRSNSFPRC
jgi:hypothetical protein